MSDPPLPRSRRCWTAPPGGDVHGAREEAAMPVGESLSRWGSSSSLRPGQVARPLPWRRGAGWRPGWGGAGAGPGRAGQAVWEPGGWARACGGPPDPGRGPEQALPPWSLLNPERPGVLDIRRCAGGCALAPSPVLWVGRLGAAAEGWLLDARWGSASRGRALEGSRARVVCPYSRLLTQAVIPLVAPQLTVQNVIRRRLCV